MGTLDLFRTEEAGNGERPSDFVTPASLANFAAMTGAISAAWSGLQRLNAPLFSALWVPFLLAGLWGVISVVMSLDSYRKDANDHSKGWKSGALIGGIFIAFLNSLVLASAVAGAGIAVGSGP